LGLISSAFPFQAGTKAKAIELCLLYVAVEDDMGHGVVVST